MRLGLGDRALCLVAEALQSTLRPGDLAGRWGGEEFCVLLARSGAGAGMAFDARLRAALAAKLGPALGFNLDFSTGLSTLIDSDDEAADELEQLLQRADAALYQAKDAGRGRLVAQPSEPADRRGTGTAGPPVRPP